VLVVVVMTAAAAEAKMNEFAALSSAPNYGHPFDTPPAMMALPR
jgi:hypothetical protein